MIAQKSVSVIPAKKHLERSVKLEQRTVRVAAYCRVSTLHEEQENSYEEQIKHFESFIRNHPKWKMAGIFADEGKSGTGKEKRPQFSAMIQQCLKGKIDVVLTKSVSRFARNTVDCLETIRLLKSKNIPVLFEKEGINTMEATGELLITILSSQAQEESRNLSENIQWALKRKFEHGEVALNHTNFLGYTKDAEGKLVIVPEEAKLVRRIFKEYLDGKSTVGIAKGLTAEGIKTVTGKDTWSASVIISILNNEKHCGDVLLQKSTTIDYLTHKRVKNMGQADQYFIENNHEPIVSKEIFYQVQAELAKRSGKRKVSSSTKEEKKIVDPKKNKEENKVVTEKSKYSSKYILHGILICGESGHFYRRQTWSKYGKKHAVWRCEDRLKNGIQAGCKHAETVKETELQRAIMKTIAAIVKEPKAYKAKEYKQLLKVVEERLEDLYQERKEAGEEVERESYEAKKYHFYNFDDVLVKRLIEKIIILRKQEIEIHFYAGMIEKVKIEEMNSRIAVKYLQNMV